MPFHVEISSGFHRARAFNLDEEKLRRTVLEPWVSGRVITLGDRDWEPKDCKLVILEGTELADADLAMGRGWSNAERTAENVTRRLVSEAAAPRLAVAVLAEVAASESAVTGMLERLELETLPWSELRARILEGRAMASGCAYAAVLVIAGGEPSASWLFDAGLARGSLGRRAVFAQVDGAAIPVQVSGVEVMRLDASDEASVRALGERLTR